MRLYNLYKMGSGGGWSPIERNIRLGIRKKHKIKKNIATRGFGKYKLCKKGTLSASYLINSNFGTIKIKKGKDNGKEITRKKGEIVSIEIAFREASKRGYRRIETFYGEKMIDENLRQKVINLIAEHEIDSGRYFYIARKRSSAGTFGQALLRFERLIELSGMDVKDRLVDRETGEILFDHVNPTFQKKFLAAFELRRREREREIAEAEKEQEKRLAEEKENFKKEVAEAGFTTT